jgi:hypothetical protein
MVVITITVEKRYGANGATTVRVRSSAATVRDALERYGPDAKLVVPIEPEGFFATEEPWKNVAEPERARPGQGIAA